MKECNKEETGCDYDCMECEVPSVEPEWCYDCSEEAERNGLEYEFLVTYESGTWTCCSCRGGC